MKGVPIMKIKYVFSLILICVFLMGCSETSYLEKTDQKTLSSSEESGETVTEEISQEIYVQVDGAVMKPGVYSLPEGSRVFTLIEKAGGFSKDAYTADVNQAEELTDGEKLTILTKSQHKKESSGDSEMTASSDGRIDINHADADELTTISGIGPTRAEAIIAYREQNGRFRKVEDITNVSGIGESTYNRIKDRIKV